MVCGWRYDSGKPPFSDASGQIRQMLMESDHIDFWLHAQLMRFIDSIIEIRA